MTGPARVSLHGILTAIFAGFLSSIIIGASSLADLAQVAAASDLAGSWVIAVDAVVLGWLVSGPVRKRFAAKRHRRPHPVAPGA
jgi:hypothetical protein